MPDIVVKHTFWRLTAVLVANYIDTQAFCFHMQTLHGHSWACRVFKSHHFSPEETYTPAI